MFFTEDMSSRTQSNDTRTTKHNIYRVTWSRWNVILMKEDMYILFFRSSEQCIRTSLIFVWLTFCSSSVSSFWKFFATMFFLSDDLNPTHQSSNIEVLLSWSHEVRKYVPSVSMCQLLTLDIRSVIRVRGKLKNYDPPIHLRTAVVSR